MTSKKEMKEIKGISNAFVNYKRISKDKNIYDTIGHD
jgi:hypothetical protein